jgi:hypothetical protein
VDEEQALWEVSTALGVTFDADAERARAHATAALLAAAPVDDEPSPLDREWHEGMARASVLATVTLLAKGGLDDYLHSGDGLEAGVQAVAKLAPLPDSDDGTYPRVLLQKLYDRRHAAS